MTEGSLVIQKKKRPLWLKIVCNIDLYIACAAVIILTIVTSISVFMRYLLNTPLLWEEEADAFCQVWMVFMGASVAFRTGGIVAIEMAVEAMPKKAQRIVGYVVDMIVLFVLVYLCVKSQAYIVQVFGRSGRSTPILRIPYSLIYGIAPWGCAAMIISYFASKYAPQFVKEIDLNFSSGSGEEAEQ